jgi:hypothetical protein
MFEHVLKHPPGNYQPKEIRTLNELEQYYFKRYFQGKKSLVTCLLLIHSCSL